MLKGILMVLNKKKAIVQKQFQVQFPHIFLPLACSRVKGENQSGSPLSGSAFTVMPRRGRTVVEKYHLSLDQTHPFKELILFPLA